MAPSDDVMEDPDLQDEAQKMALSQAKSYDTFHRYLRLPFELRAPIRALAIEASLIPGGYNGEDGDTLLCSRLASVSKEWQDDIEKALFSKIRVDPRNEEEVSKFKQYFTERRKKYLTQLEVVVDDDPLTGLWRRETGLAEISEIMEKTGQFFQQLSHWNFSSDGTNQRPIAFMFSSTEWGPGTHPGKYENHRMGTTCLWHPDDLSRVTRNGIPTNVALWAIKSEFPSSLNMVTHFTFSPDSFPVAAAKWIIGAMPNLESCVLETQVPCDFEEGWRDFTDFIHQLRSSAPSLRKLHMFNASCGTLEEDVPASMEVITKPLRDLSLNLEHFYTERFELHEAFFLPFSENADTDTAVSASSLTWPKLQSLMLRGIIEFSNLGSGQATLSPLDIVLAAAKAILAMPNLKLMEISRPGSWHLFFGRKLSNGIHSVRLCRMCLQGFSEDEERRILAAYAPFIGTDVRLAKVFKKGQQPPSRCFRPSMKSEPRS